MKIEYEDSKFVAVSRYEEKDILKQARFHWNPEEKHWESNSIFNVKNLEKYLTPGAKMAYDRLWGDYNNKISSSQAIEADIDIPVPEGKTYHPFQKAGIEYLVKHENVLLADEMGLGKTIQVIGYLNGVRPKKVLIVTPLSVKTNWYKELGEWLTYNPTIELINGKEPNFQADITLIHYDVLTKYETQLTNQVYDLVVLDEAHYIKNMKAKRTNVCLKLKGRKRFLLTGTPILNRPNELFSLLLYLRNNLIINPRGNVSYSYFTYRYCVVDEYMGYSRVVGGKNLEELQLKLRGSCMVRRLKKDVIAELPPKTRQMIPIPRYLIGSEVLKLSDDVMEKIKNETGSWEDVMRKLQSESAIFEAMSRVRHQLGISKVPMAISLIEDILENEQKVVIFAHHRDVIEAIHDHFPGSVMLYGGMTNNEREFAINEFNNNPECRVFIGSVSVAGLGINLQLSGCSTAVFVEIDWRPSYNIQAEDRLHRIGQKNAVLIYNIVVDDTLDGYIAHAVMGKQKDIVKALDEGMR